MNSEKPSDSAAWNVNLDDLIKRTRLALTPEQAALLDERLREIRAEFAPASAEEGALNGVTPAIAMDIYRA